MARIGLLPVGRQRVHLQIAGGAAWSHVVDVGQSGGVYDVTVPTDASMRIAVDGSALGESVRDMLTVVVSTAEGSVVGRGAVSAPFDVPIAGSAGLTVRVQADPLRAAAVHGYRDLAVEFDAAASFSKVFPPVVYGEWDVATAGATEFRQTMRASSIPANVVEIRNAKEFGFVAGARMNPRGAPPKERLFEVRMQGPTIRFRLPDGGDWLLELLDDEQKPRWWGQVRVSDPVSRVDASTESGVRSVAAVVDLPRPCSLVAVTNAGRGINWLEFAVDATGKLKQVGYLPAGIYRIHSGGRTDKQCLVTNGQAIVRSR